MPYSIVCSVASLLPLIILYLLFKSRVKFDYFRSKLYEFIVVFMFSLVCLEIISVLINEYTSYTKLADILMTIRWRSALLLFYFGYYYLIAYYSKINFKNAQEIYNHSKLVKINTWILIVCFIIGLFIPIDLKVDGKYNFLPGYFGYYFIFYVSLMLIFVFLYYKNMNKNKQNSKNMLEKFALIGFGMIFLLFNAFQLLFPGVSFYAISFATVLYFMYTTLENPDLEIIDNLKVLNSQIVASSNAKTDIILNVSHDIRSPMNAIVNYSAELGEIKELNKEEISNNINNILVAGKNLLSIVDDILDTSGGNTQIYMDTYNMNEMAEDLKKITESRIGNKPIKLIINIDPNLPQLLKGNSTKLYRILMNLLSNSAKYTDVGKIILSVNGTTTGNEDIMLHISVSDTGFGIKDEDKPKIFTEFSRLKDATSQKIEGTGLGIVNTKKNVEVLGGKIWFESTYGAGSTFFVDLPQKICSNQSLKEFKEQNNNKNKKLLDCSKYTVLVVDDNRMNVNVTSRLLQRYGFKVDYCYNGEECIKKIKDNNHYDLIFMDLLMDKLGGEKVLGVLRYLNKQYDIPPIVALTANVLSGIREVYLKKGFDEYLAKPIDIKELDRVINLFFNKY